MRVTKLTTRVMKDKLELQNWLLQKPNLAVFDTLEAT